jgi:hypothetical protein
MCRTLTIACVHRRLELTVASKLVGVSPVRHGVSSLAVLLMLPSAPRAGARAPHSADILLSRYSSPFALPEVASAARAPLDARRAAARRIEWPRTARASCQMSSWWACSRWCSSGMMLLMKPWRGGCKAGRGSRGIVSDRHDGLRQQQLALRGGQQRRALKGSRRPALRAAKCRLQAHQKGPLQRGEVVGRLEGDVERALWRPVAVHQWHHHEGRHQLVGLREHVARRVGAALHIAGAVADEARLLGGRRGRRWVGPAPAAVGERTVPAARGKASAALGCELAHNRSKSRWAGCGRPTGRLAGSPPRTRAPHLLQPHGAREQRVG